MGDEIRVGLNVRLGDMDSTLSTILRREQLKVTTEALTKIKERCGHVCADPAACRNHWACQAIHSAWVISESALKEIQTFALIGDEG